MFTRLPACCCATQLERIVRDPTAEGGHCFASSMELLNLEVAPPLATQAGAEPSQAAAAAGSKRLTKAERQDTLRKLSQDGWLDSHSSRPDHYTVGVRQR
jgi:hypothetical protein